jgi:hypothetical protein
MRCRRTMAPVERSVEVAVQIGTLHHPRRKPPPPARTRLPPSFAAFRTSCELGREPVRPSVRPGSLWRGESAGFKGSDE